MTHARILLLACGVALLVASLPTPTTAQGESRLQVSLHDAPKIINGDVLRGGRLPVDGASLEVQFSFRVTAPALTICPLQPITVAFAADKRAAWADQATVSLSVQSTSFFVDTLAAPGPKEYGPFTSHLSIAFSLNVPAFQILEAAVTVQAIPGSGTSGGCNLSASAPIRVPITVQSDYFPLVEVEAPAWNRHAAEPITVTNFGNGATRASLFARTSDGTLVSVGTTLVLESKAEAGANAANRGVWLLERRELPQDWIRVFVLQATSVHAGLDIQTVEEIFSV